MIGASVARIGLTTPGPFVVDASLSTNTSYCGGCYRDTVLSMRTCAVLQRGSVPVSDRSLAPIMRYIYALHTLSLFSFAPSPSGPY
jgi:hypothetical protein